MEYYQNHYFLNYLHSHYDVITILILLLQFHYLLIKHFHQPQILNVHVIYDLNQICLYYLQVQNHLNQLLLKFFSFIPISHYLIVLILQLQLFNVVLIFLILSFLDFLFPSLLYINLHPLLFF